MIAAGLHGIEQRAAAGGGVRRQRLHDSGADQVPPDAAGGADGLGEQLTWPATAFGDEVVDHYANNARVELAAYDARGHRLGAVPRLRAQLIGDAMYFPGDQSGDRGGRRVGADGRTPRRPTPPIARAAAAYETWRHVAPGDRARLLRAFAATVDEHVEELAGLEVRQRRAPDRAGPLGGRQRPRRARLLLRRRRSGCSGGRSRCRAGST